MCGRFTFKMTWKQIHDILALGDFDEHHDFEWPSSFNIAPSQMHPIAMSQSSRRLVTTAKWGFVPVWWKEAQPPRHTINARSETVAESGMFKSAFRSGRCIALASGYYEWQVQADGSKQPHYIYRADGKPLLLGSIHSTWNGEKTFAILTTSAPHGMENIHDRSPVIIEPETVSAWLQGETQQEILHKMCKPAADGVLAWHPVSKAVGNVRNNSPELLLPI